MSIFAQIPTRIFENRDAFKSYPKLNNIETKSIPTLKMRSIDTKKLLDEAKQKEGMTGIPFRFGYGFDVNYTLEDGHLGRAEFHKNMEFESIIPWCLFYQLCF